MKPALRSILFCLLFTAITQSVSAESFITSAELTPGESGYGLTVLSGDSIVRFPVTFIGRLENAMVGQDLILIRLIGEPYDKTGVIAGMSGSPIYFRGRLLGALAYGWSFSKEPIAGVTPIGLMLELVKEQQRTVAPPAGFRRLDAPLSVAGLGPDRGSEAWKRIESLGFLAAPGGRSSGPAARLEPGSAVGVGLIRGDLSITAIGTVTWTGDSDMVAFGHPFLNRGLARMPMTGARIETILPAATTSFKLGSASQDLGAILRDAQPGISGRLGMVPVMMPLSVSLQAPWGRRSYSFEICKDEIIGGQLIDIAWAMSAEAGLFAMGEAGVEVKVSIAAESRTVTLRERGVIASSILEIMPTMPVRMLIQNPFRPFFPESVAVQVQITPDLRRAEIIRLRPVRSVIAPGDSCPVEVTFRIYGGGERTERIDLSVPAGLTEGKIMITASGGRGLAASRANRPTNFDEILDQLERYEPSDVLILGVTQSSRQVTLRSGLLPELPPNVRRLHEGVEQNAPGYQVSRPMEMPVSGTAVATVEVRR